MVFLSASGLHQACPGDTRYEIFTPLFNRVTIHVDPLYGAGRNSSIVSQHNAPGPRYIQSAKLNGQPLQRCWLDHQEIVAGGTLGLELGLEPSEKMKSSVDVVNPETAIAMTGKAGFGSVPTNNRVQLFTAAGKLLGGFGEEGQGARSVCRPTWTSYRQPRLSLCRGRWKPPIAKVRRGPRR